MITEKEIKKIKQIITKYDTCYYLSLEESINHIMKDMDSYTTGFTGRSVKEILLMMARRIDKIEDNIKHKIVK